MVITQEIHLRTQGHTAIEDITALVQAAVTEAGLAAGIVTVFCPGSTAGLTTLEYEAGVVADLQRVFDELAPPQRAYRHHLRWGDDNGSAHVRAALIGPSLVVPFVAGTAAKTDVGEPMNSHLDHTAPVRAVTSRLYETEDDLRQMQGMLMAARAYTNDWRYAHVGELMWGFFMVACHLNLREYIRLWHDDEDKLVGYAILGEDPSIDWQALPEYEWTGIETEVMEWVETRLAELRKGDPQRWSGPLVSGARQDNAARIAFLEQHGFRYRGEFTEVNMLRSLAEPIPASALPAGCQVRAVVADADEISMRAAAERAVWQPWTDGNVSDDDYATLMRLPGYQRDLDVVAVTPDGVIAAYVTGWLDPVNRIGDFGDVGALPAYRQRGWTRAVLLEGLRRMQAAGMDRVCVSTGETNTPARRLYESVGFKIVNKYLDYVR